MPELVIADVAGQVARASVLRWQFPHESIEHTAEKQAREKAVIPGVLWRGDEVDERFLCPQVLQGETAFTGHSGDMFLPHGS